ncbi:MAG: hypothetical protein ABIG84_08505 [archaeon]
MTHGKRYPVGDRKPFEPFSTCISTGDPNLDRRINQAIGTNPFSEKINRYMVDSDCNYVVAGGPNGGFYKHFKPR